MAKKYGMIVDSFVDAEGSAVINGRKWRWEFHEFLGPTFVNAKGTQVSYPREGSPVWDAFNAWLWNYYLEKKDKRGIDAMSKWYIPKIEQQP